MPGKRLFRPHPTLSVPNLPIGDTANFPYIRHAERHSIHQLINFAGEFMATARKAAKGKQVSKAAAPVAHKPIKEALGKSGLVAHIAEISGVVAKDVRAVLAALEGAVHGSVHKKGAGSFTLPGMLKISAVSVPAKPKRKGINPFTKEEQWFAAKPATTKVKIRPLKKLKDAAA